MKKLENIRKTFGKSTMSRVTTFHRQGVFTSSEESVKDKERRGKPTTTKMLENIVQIEQVLKKDRRVSCRKIVESNGYQKQLFNGFYRTI